MAAFLVTTTEPGREFKVGDIIAYAEELKRRKIAKDKPVHLIGKTINFEVQLEMRTPVRAKRKVIPAAPAPSTKTPMRGARKARS